MEAVAVYLRTRRSEGYSPATLRQVSYQLNRFGAWVGPRPIAEVSLQTLRDFVAGFSHLKAQSLGHLVRILEGAQGAQGAPESTQLEALEVLRDACRKPVEHALLEFLFATGCRISEAQGVDRNQIEWDRKCVLVFGKGPKEREVYFGARCALWLRRYLSTRSDHDGDHAAEPRS